MTESLVALSGGPWTTLSSGSSRREPSGTAAGKDKDAVWDYNVLPPRWEAAMKVESRLFELLAAFFFVSAIIYVLLSHEPAGTAALLITGGFGLIIGTYFRFVSRRLETRPEDNPEAEISDGSGDVGFFSPGSYWPVTMAGAVALVALSLAFFYVWLLVITVALLLVAVCGFVFEYHIHSSDH